MTQMLPEESEACGIGMLVATAKRTDGRTNMQDLGATPWDLGSAPKITQSARMMFPVPAELLSAFNVQDIQRCSRPRKGARPVELSSLEMVERISHLCSTNEENAEDITLCSRHPCQRGTATKQNLD